MSNYMDEDNAADGFRDGQDDEIDQSETPAATAQAQPVAKNRVFPTQQTVVLPAAHLPDLEQVQEEEQEEDYSEILNDASLRLEQGNLYKMVMNSDLFANSGYDEKAVANVTREIRNFAKERMEIMLGMRQEVVKDSFSAAGFPFNALEVEVLKMLASTATKGASQEAEPFTPMAAPQRRSTLNPISVKSPQRPQQTAPKAPAKPLRNTPTAPVKRSPVSEAVQRILEEEGVTLEQINQTFDPNKKYLTPDELDSLTKEQMEERNKQIARSATKKAASPGALPMPSQEQIDAIYSNRAAAASAHPQMQMIMNAINNKK